MSNNFSLKHISIVLLLVSCRHMLYAQRNELPADTVATVGARVITAKDFLERFELMPVQGKDVASRIETTKLQFLYSMAAEKLLALEATQQNIGSDSVTQKMQHTLERTFVRDELYKREVVQNSEPTMNEMLSAYQRAPFTIDVDILGVLKKEDGEKLFRAVTKSKNKEKTLQSFDGSLFTFLDTLSITLGSTEKRIEDAVFGMMKDSVTQPMLIEPHGWVMMKLKRKYSNPKYVNESRSNQIISVRRIIQNQKQDSIAKQVFAQFLGQQRAQVDSTLFRIVADSVYKILMSDTVAHTYKKNFILFSSDVEKLEEIFAPLLTAPFAAIQSGDMTLGDVLIGLKNSMVVFPNMQKNVVLGVLNNNFRIIVQNELLAREGFKKNFQQSENVRHDIATWMDNRRTMLMFKQIKDTLHVSDQEVMTAYNKNQEVFGAQVEVNIREILLDTTLADVKLAVDLRKRILAGEDIAALAKKYSRRKEWKEKGGESGFFNIESKQYPQLGMYASHADSGQLVGPLRISEGETLFKIIGRRIIDDSLRLYSDDVKKTVRAKLLQEKLQKVLDGYIGTLAKKYGVTLNENNLRNVKTTTISMVTWRNIGFGGRFLAVPPVYTQVGWVQEWHRNENINQ